MILEYPRTRARCAAVRAGSRSRHAASGRISRGRSRPRRRATRRTQLAARGQRLGRHATCRARARRSRAIGGRCSARIRSTASSSRRSSTIARSKAAAQTLGRVAGAGARAGGPALSPGGIDGGRRAPAIWRGVLRRRLQLAALHLLCRRPDRQLHAWITRAVSAGRSSSSRRKPRRRASSSMRHCSR